jgi:tyrosine phenol-lyase
MSDFAKDLFARTIAEPYRTKVVEKLRLPDRADRERILKEAFYSPVRLSASDVYVDMITDSGAGAMSDRQWAALMQGDEAYFNSRSFLAFEGAVREVMGFAEVIPVHQGRAAEKIIMELMVKPGDIVLSNTHFDTTKAHVENRQALPVDLVGDWLWHFEEPRPFKGNFDLQKLELALERYHERVPLVIITVLNNFAGSSPVSMENIREVRRLADKHAIPVFFDASRFAENSYFIKTCEPGYEARSVADIAHEMLSYGHGCWMSAKKDALVNMGGFIATDDGDLAQRCREKVVLNEGFYTYGGLARRDLEAIAVGLREGIEEDYLAHRVRLVAYLGAQMQRAGAVVSEPVGGSGVFLDVEAMYPHLTPDMLPSVALCADMYLEGGVRVGAAPFPMNTVALPSAEIVERVFQFARFAVPRRVYGKSHMDYVAGVVSRVKEKARANQGYRVTYKPQILGHFFSKFEPLSPGDAAGSL